MDTLQLLPSELVLEILRHVTLSDLSSLRRLNKAWNELITSNEDSVFKELALYRLHAQPPCDHPDRRHKGWKQVCQCSVNSDLMRKHKIATVDHIQYPSDFHPWRIKVDREHQLLFASTTDMPSDFMPDPARPTELPHPHGLKVTDLRTKRIIQTIPEVKQYAHLEYDAGYIVATGNGDIMSVYRTPWAVPPSSPSSVSGITSKEPPATNERSTDTCTEAPLAIHGSITSPGYRALRMNRTTLVTASETRIEIFDVPTLQLVKRIEIPRRQIAMIMYIELDDEYIFLCGLGYAAPLPPAHARTVSNIPPPEPQVYVYRRNPTSADAAYFAIPLRPSEGETPYASINKYIISPDPSDLEYKPPLNVKITGRKQCVTADIARFQDNLHGVAPPFSPDVPVACHYGSRHLVVLCRNGSLLIMQDYKTTFNLPPVERAKRTFTLSMPPDGPEYWNLAVQDDVAYITTYHDRRMDPWAMLIAIDLTTLQRSTSLPVATNGDSLGSVITGQIDFRSWDIPEPSHLAHTHSLQATSEGVYMPVRIVSTMEHYPDNEFYITTTPHRQKCFVYDILDIRRQEYDRRAQCVLQVHKARVFMQQLGKVFQGRKHLGSQAGYVSFEPEGFGARVRLQNVALAIAEFTADQ
ncbi:hypothetical protein QFC21_006534 [Naganishia friedmannii]|uniref:Uncharacterized protein n=1 Tax=Naganishia friedmannii TaxID=89922 RepID=A0ACC2V1T1_9TREE|nr:hypothetical protein QFC21_006534 [Naganishia friedmannii]